MCVWIYIYFFNQPQELEISPLSVLGQLFCSKLAVKHYSSIGSLSLGQRVFRIKFLNYTRQAYNGILSQGHSVKIAVYKESTLFQNSTALLGEIYIFTSDSGTKQHRRVQVLSLPGYLPFLPLKFKASDSH